MLGALLWIIYGVLINALPVIVANVLVFAAAAWTTFRAKREAGNSKSKRAPFGINVELVD